MPEATALTGTESLQTVTPEALMPRRRILALCVVLSTSVLHFVMSSSYYVLGGTYLMGGNDRIRDYYRVASALTSELTSLLLLWYVLSQRGRSWRDLGRSPAWFDVFRALGIVILTYIASYFTNYHFQMMYRSVAGHYLQPGSRHGLLGLGGSALMIAFVLVNPVFEEVIVRSYTMTEIIALGGGPALAVVVSVAIQMSYHLYQGVLNSVILATTFTVFSVYFVKTRRIMPIILAHLFFDAHALFKGSF